jgi:hypothetical protein
MSGLEIAGVLLGTFPLIISGLEHWREVARVGGYLWKVRKECTKCRTDIHYHEIVFKRNLKELLLPIISDADEVTRLLGDPGGVGWSDKNLQGRMEIRLQEAYSVYMSVVKEMNEAAEELRKELCLDKTAVQSGLLITDAKKLKPKSVLSKSNLDYQLFKVKFSLGEPVRDDLFATLKRCNERLGELLSTSEKISTLQMSHPRNNKQTFTLEAAFKMASKESSFLFEALQKAWQCSCQEQHFANLRLEHRTLPEICFEVILMFEATTSLNIAPWSWREVQCGHMISCSQHALRGQASTPTRPSLSKTSPRTPSGARKVAFNPQTSSPIILVGHMLDSAMKLCQTLSGSNSDNCIGIVGHDDKTYHLHHSKKRKRPTNDNPLTLDHILSRDFEGFLSRRQRYCIALLVASSVAQLHLTPWLRTGLTKKDILFFPDGDNDCDIPHNEPFIRQGFAPQLPGIGGTDAKDSNFYTLGILLLELCFGSRLEDQSFRKKHTTVDVDSKQAFDLMAAMRWLKDVSDEGGVDYATAVEWCFTGAGDIITNVILPLEHCQKHFETATKA